MITSYCEIFNIGHKAIEDLFKHPVVVEEKVDGSQFSFQIKDGEYCARSKGQQIAESVDKMFQRGVEATKGLPLHDGWVYRGEYLQKPKHNALAYSRIPINHVILFDIERGDQFFLSREDKEEEARRIGLEIVPILYRGAVTSLEQFNDLLDTESVLGGQKIEGVVIKPMFYDLFGRDKKVLMGKWVSAKYREIQKGEWRVQNPGKGDIIEVISKSVCTKARWEKAIQHLREQGLIEDDPRDIGKIIMEIPKDVEKECKELIEEALWKWAWPQIRRSVTRGMPEWYKEKLLKSVEFGE